MDPGKLLITSSVHPVQKYTSQNMISLRIPPGSKSQMPEECANPLLQQHDIEPKSEHLTGKSVIQIRV